MPLKVICPAFSRSGTSSLRDALNLLGFGPCYHMHDVFKNPSHIDTWRKAYRGEQVNWDAIFAGYASATDSPACHFWEQLMAYSPSAKVILALRDPESWYESMRETVYLLAADPNRYPKASERPGLELTKEIIFDGAFQGRFTDKNHSIITYRSHAKRVKAQVPGGRFLQYELGQGWKPICDFLECDIPDQPFPHSNTRDRFKARFHAKGK